MNFLTGYEMITPWGMGKDAFNIEVDRKLASKVIPSIKPSALGWKGMNRFSRSCKLSCLAIGEAMKKAGLSRLDESSELKTGMVVGTTFSNLEAIGELEDESLNYGVNNVKPGIFPNTVINAIGGYASIYFNIKGTNITLSNGDATGPQALLYANDLLNQGGLDRVIVCICNTFPPEKYRDSCLYNNSFESVIAYVLEKEPKRSNVNCKVHLAYFPYQQGVSNDIRTSDFSMGMLVNQQKLQDYNLSYSIMSCNLGVEGSLTLSLYREMENHV